MRIKSALAVLLVIAAISGCTSSGSAQSDPYCVRLEAASHRLASAQRDLFGGGNGSQAALARIVGELHGLQNGAPADIRQALAQLVAAFQEAEQALRHSTQQSRQQLTQAAEALSRSGKKVSDYVASKCQ